MNKKQLLSAVHNMLENLGAMDRFTSRCSDPTSILHATAWITFDYGAPAPFPPQKEDPEYPGCTPGPATVRLWYTASWTSDIKLDCDGDVYDCRIFDSGNGDGRGEMPEDIQSFLIEALCHGRWSTTEPREPTEEEIMAEEADAFLLACAR